MELPGIQVPAAAGLSCKISCCEASSRRSVLAKSASHTFAPTFWHRGTHARPEGASAALLTVVYLFSRRAGRAQRGRGTFRATSRNAVLTAPELDDPEAAESRMRYFEIPQAAPAGSAPAWRNEHWFPIASLGELDPLRPTAVRIDGLDLVVWREPSSEKNAGSDEECWKVFANSCPHRLAPLSEGRIEPKTGCLQCAYHGWEFDGKGACTRIPQVTQVESQRMRANPRSGAVAFPTQVAFNCIWAWLGDETPKGSPKDLAQGNYLSETDMFSTYTRDVPYGYDSLLENFVDVSHIPFAHHGLQGTRDDARPVTMTVPNMNAARAEHSEYLMNFHFEDHTTGRDRKSDFFLLSPFLFVYNGEFEHKEGESGEKRRFRLSICCVPVSPGHSRMIILNPRTRSGPMGALFSVLPVWLIHIFSNRFIDSDLAFLHYQERNLRRERSAEDWNKSYFMPAQSDRSISAWRKWLSSEGARCVLPGPGSELPPSPSSREELLNRYKQHTSHCVHCQEGLASLEAWQSAAIGIGVLSLVVDRCFGVGPTLLWVGGQIFAVGAVLAINRLRQQLHFVDYEHYKT